MLHQLQKEAFTHWRRTRQRPLKEREEEGREKNEREIKRRKTERALPTNQLKTEAAREKVNGDGLWVRAQKHVSVSRQGKKGREQGLRLPLQGG